MRGATDSHVFRVGGKEKEDRKSGPENLEDQHPAGNGSVKGRFWFSKKDGVEKNITYNRKNKFCRQKNDFCLKFWRSIYVHLYLKAIEKITSILVGVYINNSKECLNYFKQLEEENWGLLFSSTLLTRIEELKGRDRYNYINIH